MENKKILVTGANGYIGSHVVKTLLDLGCDVVATDINDNNIDERATIIKSNIFNVSPDEDLFKKYGEPDVCLHMAWIDGFVHNSDNHLLYLSSHYNFLNNLISHGLKQVAVMGTMHEIGFYEGMVDENTPTNPLSMYGISKNALRKAIELKCKEKEVIYQWLRCFYITGDDLKANSIFGKILKADKEGKELFPFTSGQNMYDFIDINELSEQLSKAVMQSEVSGIINCCTGEPRTLADRVEQYIVDNGLNIKLEYGAYPDRPYDSRIIYGDATKINNIKKKYEEESVKKRIRRIQ